MKRKFKSRVGTIAAIKKQDVHFSFGISGTPGCKNCDIVLTAEGADGTRIDCSFTQEQALTFVERFTTVIVGVIPGEAQP